MYHLAQINVARMIGSSIDAPIMKTFVDNLDKINALAESSDGFIWRLKDEDGDATSFNPYQDDQIIINMSVWRDVESLKEYVYKTAHAEFIKLKKEWFIPFGSMHMAMWWINSGEVPTPEEGIQKIGLIDTYGPTTQAFNFKNIFDQPRT